MRLLLVFGLSATLATLACAGQQPAARGQAAGTQTPAENNLPANRATIDVPPGTKLVVSATTPLWSKTVQAGDHVYAISTFPVAIDNQMAVPPGTYLEGIIDALNKPTRKTNRADFQMHFIKMIFANGYTVALAENPAAVSASVNVEVSYTSDILLDIGSQFELMVQRPLSLDAGNVAEAALRSKAPPIGPMESATRCRPTAGTAGTSDTIIPGTPGTPGTPPTVIPGGPGMPDTVIPGSPGTPGTSPTIIPGSPGTPGFSCPGPPIVVSGPSAPSARPDDHVGYVTFRTPVEVAGKNLPAGTYQIAWSGPGPTVTVKVNQKGKQVLSVPAHLVGLKAKAPEDEMTTHHDASGADLLVSIQFQGQTLQLVFD